MSDNAPGTDRYANFLNSTALVTIARIGLPTLLAIIGSLMLIVLHDVENAIVDVKGSTEKLWMQISDINKAAAQAAIAATAVSGDLTAADKVIADHETRLRTLERVAR